MILYIIGNGFDLEHGLKTSYYDFRKYIEKNNNILAREIERMFSDYGNIDELWSVFESSLSIFDIDFFANKIDCSLLGSLGDDNWSDSSWYDTQNHLSEETKIFEEIKKLLYEWISTIKNNSSFRRIDIGIKDYYINFNYTTTLEDLYNISKDSVFHVHGKLGEELILGHKIKYSDEFENLKFDPKGNPPLYDPYNEDFRIDELRKIISNRTNEFYKPIKEELIPKLLDWLGNIPEPCQIRVVGHSYGYVDWEYFSCLKSRYPSASWDFFAFDSKTEKNLCEMLRHINNLGIN